ncbi:hypothetical protein PO124_15470 [Bacillus licheniformis]|nr:hypothetical protein [Bacillus licheniformis]
MSELHQCLDKLATRTLITELNVAREDGRLKGRHRKSDMFTLLNNTFPILKFTGNFRALPCAWQADG